MRTFKAIVSFAVAVMTLCKTVFLFIVAAMTLWVASVFFRLALYGAFPDEITWRLHFTAASLVLAAIAFVGVVLRRKSLRRQSPTNS